MSLPDYLTDDMYNIDDVEFVDRLHQSIRATKAVSAPTPHRAPPSQVDLSKYLHYIRKQGGAGCWGYSMLAVWDIMNEMTCPYSPNLSMNLWLKFHHRRDLWEKQGGINGPSGRFHKMTNPEYGFVQSFGLPTEGTELTCPTIRWTGSWTREGTNEAYNYRLKSLPEKIAVSSSEFIKWLAVGHPIRVKIPYHFVAIVGYDAQPSKQTFTYVNSAGDRWRAGGFGTYTFQQVDDKNPVEEAEVIHIIPPKPVPAARIRFTTPPAGGRRLNVNLWLSVADSPLLRRKIWPVWEWDDDSANLDYTVRLPSEFMWPPSQTNRLVLDLYDSGAFSDTGGTLEEFTAAFGGHIVKCSELSRGPISFGAREHRRFHIP
jgi:hypothetical protein